MADNLKPDDLPHILDRYAKMCCPVFDIFQQQYHWSLMQAEYSTDLTQGERVTTNGYTKRKMALTQLRSHRYVQFAS